MPDLVFSNHKFHSGAMSHKLLDPSTYFTGHSRMYRMDIGHQNTAIQYYTLANPTTVLFFNISIVVDENNSV